MAFVSRCLSPLVTVVREYIHQALDKNSEAKAVALDMSKALKRFDILDFSTSSVRYGVCG